mmetsp:Transcript_24322/g.51759  ORF Transcript_24322/g.51759 Transcript_24322/m.51759 type:complete len:282 (-) Transcript_24322:297-1142(-)
MDFLSQVASTVPASHSVTYSCTLTNLWSAATHPFDYARISNSAHWSPPVLSAHNKRYNMWKPDMMASPGVEDVAESGSTTELLEEFDHAMAKDKAGEVVVGFGQFNIRNEPQTLGDITMTPSFPLLSSITMVAPSPDWFTGFYNVNPVDEETMVWYETFEIATYPWDAGTEQGNTYSIDNGPEVPQVAISRLTKDSEQVSNTGILLSPDGEEVLPMASWKCELVSSECTDGDLMYRGRKKSTCDWVAKKKTSKRCKKKWKGMPLSDWCPKTCGSCTAELSL